MNGIRDAGIKDAVSLARIYNHYIQTSTATFEIDPIKPQDMNGRIEKITTENLPFLVYVDADNGCLGYAYASKWRAREAYRNSVEISIYLDPNQTGRGLGRQLYDVLFERLRQQEFHIAIGGITLPNPASIGLHEKFGVKKVAHFEEVGFKFGKWVDVGYWQVKL